MSMEVRLLGQIEARVDGRHIDIGHARQQCVLAVLLIEPNRPVPASRLVDRVWGDHPPQRANGVLYNYLSRLRRAFAGSDDLRIVRQTGGFVALIDPLAVDLHRFVQLTTRARTTGDDSQAFALFEQALGLWRGEAFGSVDNPWLSTVRAGLHRQRLAAQLDRNDLALRLGRHADVLTELLDEVAAHPLDERLAGQLMFALYRSGRQSDALNRFEAVRRRLAEELGVDPSPPLRELHRRILVADPALDAPVPRTKPVAAPVVPRQLPTPSPSFVGRSAATGSLDALLAETGDSADRVVVAVVTGMAGVGKTTLATQWAHRVAHRFPDGQLYVNLRGFDPSGDTMSPTEALRGFLHALGVPAQRIPAELDAQVGLYRSLLADRRVLVVLDNAHDAEQVGPLLPGSGPAMVVVTSRNQLSGLATAYGAHPVPLEELTVDESRLLLSARLGEARVTAEERPVQDIIERCARLPLALAIVAARAAHRRTFALAAFADELRDIDDRLEALAGGEATADVRAVFSWSYGTLTPDAARLFRLLGLHPGPDISVATAASLAGVPLRQVRTTLAELVRANLVVETVHSRFTMHDLLRAYAGRLAGGHDTDAERRSAYRRVLDHYLHTAYTAALLMEPTRTPIDVAAADPAASPERPEDYDAALAWFDAEHANLLAAINLAAGIEADRHVWQLAWTLVTFLDRRVEWDDWMHVQLAAVSAAQRLADPGARAQSHRLLAGAYLRLNRVGDADTHLRIALDMHRLANDRVGEGRSYLEICRVSMMRGDHAAALAEAQLALKLFQSAGERGGEGDALNAVGWFHILLGDYDLAIEACERALALQQELGDRAGEAGTWDSLGYAHAHRGDYGRAVICYQRSLELFRELNDRYQQADTSTCLGDAQSAAGDAAAAHDAWHHALTILTELDHPDADQVRTKIDLLGYQVPR